MVDRTGTGDPLRVLPLLWRPGQKVGRKGLTLATIVDAAIALADGSGIDQVSMRKLADEVGVGTMTLYAHLPGRAELLDLMVDRVHGEVSYSPSRDDAATWRDALEEVGRQNWALLARHRWLLDVDITRPPLGPGTIGKYDAELRGLADTGLDDVQMDQSLSLILEHLRSSARQVREPSGGADDRSHSDSEWWGQAGPVLSALMDATSYPLAARVGESAGQEYGAPVDPERFFRFGLTAILDGIGALIDAE